MKKKVPTLLLAALVVAAALLYFLPTKTFDELMPVPDHVAVTATYWHTDNSCSIAKWEAGSPQAEEVLKDLRSASYSKSPIYTFTYRLRRVNHYLNGNAGVLTLELVDDAGNKYLTGVQNGTFNFFPPDGWLSKGWMATDPDLGNKLIEPFIIAPET